MGRRRSGTMFFFIRRPRMTGARLRQAAAARGPWRAVTRARVREASVRSDGRCRRQTLGHNAALPLPGQSRQRCAWPPMTGRS